MELEGIEVLRYGFDLDWFLCKCTLRTEEIDNFYNKYYLDYKKFVNSFVDHFGLSDTVRKNCLSEEKKCIFCKKNYPYNVDSFIYIQSKNKDITKDLCYDCIQGVMRCKKCKVMLYQEPYTIVDYNKRDNFCSECA